MCVCVCEEMTPHLLKQEFRWSFAPCFRPHTHPRLLWLPPTSWQGTYGLHPPPGYWCKMPLVHPLSDLLLGFHVTWRIRMSLCSEWSWKNSVCASWRQTVTTVPPIYCLINSEGAPLTLLVYNLARDTPSYWLSQEAEPSGYVQMTIS